MLSLIGQARLHGPGQDEDAASASAALAPVASAARTRWLWFMMISVDADLRGVKWRCPPPLATAAAGRRVMASLPRDCRPCVSRRAQGVGVDQGGDYRVAAQPVQAPAAVGADAPGWASRPEASGPTAAGAWTGCAATRSSPP